MRVLRAFVIVALVAVTLSGAGYEFVLKSIPYQTPQLSPPRVRLVTAEADPLAAYPAGLAEVPVLTWRDVSPRRGSLVTAPKEFATELAALRAAGFRGVSPAELALVAAGKRAGLPRRAVVLAFDDGLSTDWTTVDPILREYGFTAMAFIDPVNVATKSPSYYLTKDELSSMAGSGRWVIGVRLAGGWRSQSAASGAGRLARDRLSGIVGRPVTIAAWPPTRSGGSAEEAEPGRFAAAMRRSFQEVFGRPASGAAGYVASGNGSAPWARIRVTAEDTPATLAARLRAGALAPPPRDPLTLSWRAAGGRCERAPGGLTVTTLQFALCTPEVNGSRWGDYELRFTVSAARAGTIAVVEVRVGAAGAVEIAIGRAGLTIRQADRGSWTVLKTVTVWRTYSGAPVPFLGTTAIAGLVRVTGRTLLVQVGGVTAQAAIGPSHGFGLIALGAISPGGQESVSYSQPVIVTRP